MNRTVFHTTYPIWIGIGLNVLFTAINVSTNSNWWFRYSPLILGVLWFVLICLAIYNYKTK